MSHKLWLINFDKMVDFYQVSLENMMFVQTLANENL